MRSSFLMAFVFSACGSAHLVTGNFPDGGAGGTATAGGSTAGGSAGGGVAGGTTAGGSAGGSMGGGSMGGGASGGVTGGGAVGGGSVAGGTAGGGSAGGAASCSAATCSTGCCLNGTCQPGTQLLACGTGGVACAQCMMGQACAPSTQTCGLDPQSQWVVHPVSAGINSTKPSGSNWDTLGDPDPYANLYCPATAGSVTAATSSLNNDYQPMWNDGECTLTADQLMTTGFAFSVYDSDGLLGGADDLIAPKTTMVVTESDLNSGTISFGATSGLMSITFSLTGVP